MDNKDLMTIGEFAKRMKVTVRTLQYYDSKGLLKPSQYSGCGRRLYTDRDFLQLHQILSMKHLGFSLKEIKDEIISIDSPQEVKKMLDKQAEVMKEKISILSETLNTIQTLRFEINEINRVDFNKYATIIEKIREKDEDYVLIKYFDNEILDDISTRFSKESAKDFMKKLQDICKKVNLLKAQNEKPEGIKGQKIAKEWWDYMQTFSGGNMELIQKMTNLYQNNDEWKHLLKERKIIADEFIEKSLYTYLQRKNGLGESNE